MSDAHRDSVLDREVIEGLKALDVDGGGLLAELVNLFLDDTPTRLEALRQSLVTGDAKGVEESAHSLKSSCGNLGAHGLADIFKKIEFLGRQGQLDDVPGLVAKTDDEYVRVQDALRAELD